MFANSESPSSLERSHDLPPAKFHRGWNDPPKTSYLPSPLNGPSAPPDRAKIISFAKQQSVGLSKETTICRRIEILEESWDGLGATVRTHLAHLVTRLEERDFRSAEVICTALAVDHIKEVGQWIAGFRMIIHERKRVF